MRLDREAYVATQPIYYPGFTIGAIFGEVGGLIATLILLVLTPRESREFAWTAMAFVALLAMHLAYWMFTHPVNAFWLKDFQLKGLGRGFFRFAPLGGSARGSARIDDWTQFRNRWEYSHVLRAALAGLGFVCLVIAVAV